ncbi:class I SAM-dependent methyltransferase [Acidisoma cellulosilytica]|uniref:Class I SAM-dependent methyltransferase n=1 Tax=Acidisoma cellulosilyticum TaxID=2802395 RepID=A0A963Z4D5_9PROT|nr:class I SAM-dependent methyltransferase [Acidisoma cellulosilyticum]MCB8882562.1 class I SAM-dependent methyltransferase [Acidisoma cellulosilyticum]
MATPAEIAAAFHWLLGRAATADEVRAWAAVPEAALRERLMATEAFAIALPSSAVRMRDERQAIEWDVSSDIAAELLARVQAHWTRLGETMPHWSVAGKPAFMPDQIDGNRAAFLASGAQDVAHLVTILARHGWQPGDLPRVMDFGCGVGRMTAPMADWFSVVAGCDVSPSHLALARAACGSRVQFSLVNALDFGMAAPFDLWFSTRTLQHNPPPVTALILRRAFSLLTPGGVAVFQVPTARVGYSYDSAAALSDSKPSETLPIHVLPQGAVFALAAEAGCIPVEVLEDSMVWPPTLCRSNSFVIRKPRS